MVFFRLRSARGSSFLLKVMKNANGEHVLVLLEEGEVLCCSRSQLIHSVTMCSGASDASNGCE